MIAQYICATSYKLPRAYYAPLAELLFYKKAGINTGISMYLKICSCHFLGRSYLRKNVHWVLVNRLVDLSLSRKSVVRLTDRPNMTLAVDRGR